MKINTIGDFNRFLAELEGRPLKREDTEALHTLVMELSVFAKQAAFAAELMATALDGGSVEDVREVQQPIGFNLKPR